MSPLSATIGKMSDPNESYIITRIVEQLQDQVPNHQVRYESNTLWVGEWKAVPEVRSTLVGFHMMGEDPISTTIGIVIDALLERDPSASRPPLRKKKSSED